MKTKDEIEAKRLELETALKDTVTAAVVYPKGNSEDQAVGYFRNPSRTTKMMALDKAIQTPSTAGQMILEACLIKEESDPRIMDEKKENDAIFMGFCMKALGLIEIATDIKKN